MQETIIILDFGSQYTQLIARRIRELNVYSKIIPWDAAPEISPEVKGVILSGSPFSVLDENAPQPKLEKYINSIPVLGVCYGAQFMAQNQGGKVEHSSTREYGRANLAFLDSDQTLLKGMSQDTQVWMSHGDSIQSIPEHFNIICSTETVAIGGYKIGDSETYGIQFHPEVYHSLQGKILLKNFVVDICGCSQSWTPEAFVESTVESLKSTLQNDEVVMGLSGGVDSSVAAMLIHRAIGDRLHCIFVDNGLLRKNEYEQVLKNYQGLGLNITGVKAADRFYEALKGIQDPELKRKAIGKTFIEIFEGEAKRIQGVDWLGQGTIYPDVIESVSVSGGPSQTIKSHHNVGGLPDRMHLKVVEPLKLLFKDEVREVGQTLNIPDYILGRHPFPGPGLGIRILGDITAEKVRLLQEADAIFIEGLKKHNLYDKVWQAGVMLLPVQSVGVMGDERTYENVVALRAVESTDGMTADWSPLPYAFLAKVSNEIINQVKGINRVVYDISSKPPSTIEWE